jgi:curved DNA-binding protein CbpA
LSQYEDYYAVLGVLPSIEQTALSAVYKALMSKYHPDVYEGDKAEGERKAKQINAAYEVLGNETKRAKYDRDRKTTENGSGDYGQESYTSEPNQSEQDVKLENWDFAIDMYPEAEIYRIELNRFSPQLSLLYQFTLLELKKFSHSSDLADKLKEEFLTRYFGSNFEIHKFVEACLRNNRRDVALGVNKAIKIVGSPSEADEEKFISRIRNKFDYYENDYVFSQALINKSERVEALSLIEKISLLNVSKDMLEELAEYESQLASGEFEKTDLIYLSALYKRLRG